MNRDPVNILLVEDNPGDMRLVREMLDECGCGQFRLLHAEQILAAIPILDGERIDILLLDLTLPDGSGLDTLVKMHALAAGVPIVVLSHVEDEGLAVKAVRMGAQDFLVKSHISGPLLTRSLRYALERRQIEDHLYQLAHYDGLTGLPNRKLFYDRLSRALASARRHQSAMALMLLDVNEFKQINDDLGHHAGDQLLKEIAARLSVCLRSTDCVARLGGDEFVIYVSDLADAQQAARVAQKVLEALAPPYELEGRQVSVHSSLGIALHPADADDVETLVRNADAAMYMAKAEGRSQSRCRFFSRDMNAATSERAELEVALRLALERGEFRVHYQPQVDLRSGRVIGMEALLRWQRPGAEPVMPMQFLSTLEESGLIVPVGEWVLASVCRQAMAWQAEGFSPLTVAVNISPRQFRDRRLVESVARALRESGLAPPLLELELTEECLRDDEEAAQATLSRLNALGVRLALDNYGVGSTSLRYLKRFPIHSVKIDRSVVRDMTSSPEEAAIVQAVIAVAHVFKMKGVAEGVETRGQAEFLRQQSCDDAQGYAFGRPLSAEACTAFLRQCGGKAAPGGFFQ
jgi:diguanylate cyclase (GGDEF)-like protein